MLFSFALLLCHANIAQSAPIKKDRHYYEQKGDILWEVKTHQKIAAITFDDGPDPVETVEILNELKKYNAKCTFFVLGKRVAAYPEVSSKVIQEGHELANHTYNHVYFKKSSEQQIIQELRQTENEIKKISGKGSKFFRPPGGIYNETVINAAKHVGLKPVLWSWHQDTRDWSKPGVKAITSHVLKNIRSGDIILMHDSVNGKSQTRQALSIILPELKRRGFHLVTVSELIRSQEIHEVKK